jgi:sterol desaturase/sphingolipid hydroxylase (fatty acid hydroxylase superfamily)
MKLAHDMLDQFLLTLWHVFPWLAGMGVVFTLLSRLSPCNKGKDWWEKKGLATDLAYWVFAPVFMRYMRIWVTVMFTIWLFHISDGNQIADFYLHGHGRIAQWPLWVQTIVYLVASDFLLYWSHRIFHRGFLWKYHAVHHASRQVEWLSAARFHPVNLAFGTIAVDIAALLSGFSPDIFLFIGPFNVMTSCFVHANLDWSLGPLRYVLVGPVYHRWHHAMEVRAVNFASTFAVWDLMFATWHMPRGVLPQAYGIDDTRMPEGLLGQLAYPLLQDFKTPAAEPAQAGA